MKSDLATRDNTKYCGFHRDYRHRTDNCIQLKKEIEYLKTAWIPPAFHNFRESGPESGLESGPESNPEPSTTAA